MSWQAGRELCRRGIRIVVGIIPVIAIMLVSAACLDNEPRSRSSYRPFNWEEDAWLSAFSTAYEDGLKTRADWLQDPAEVALRAAGYSTELGYEPESYKAYQMDPSRITYIMFDGGLMDDSLEAEESRIDLVQSDGLWQIEWAGARFRCRRSVYSGWVTGLCP